ncbi:hypothetical protein B0T18DRAFT_245491 [Schizothecium vesticola]|uniref:DUF5672 domain-containing protein n=1 Tax=Schizothecium vesticola TaxID=314040 RepID=A0AA40BQ71_9PEZI|nr:hypothetical protein B0T18DRAFT_245491 [Schizothecium vesticola]
MSSSPASLFVVTRTKFLVVVSLIITWWFASILPHYQPAIKASFKARLGEAVQQLPSIKVDWPTPGHNPRDAYNASKLALLIEPRPLTHLVPHILHMMAVVPPDWRFLFIGTEESVAQVGRAYSTQYQQVIGKLDLMVLPEPWKIDTKELVWRTLTDSRFYDEFLPGVEWLLKYESDSIMCANSEKSLNDWLDWSWVGAPKTWDDRFFGSGGLSLRRMSIIRQVLEFQARYNDTDPEDKWFGTRVELLPGAKVPPDLMHALAVEDVYFEKPMGFHIRNGGSFLPVQVWLDPNRRQAIFDYCPELALIMDMRLKKEACPGDDSFGEVSPNGPNDTRLKMFAEAMAKAQADAANKTAHES